jgi:hypothetical protein
MRESAWDVNRDVDSREGAECAEREGRDSPQRGMKKNRLHKGEMRRLSRGETLNEVRMPGGELKVKC